jgi:hypothetical protein
MEFALGDERSVWVWDDAKRIWKGLRPEERNFALREHDITLRQLRRAVPVLRLFLDGDQDAEREAAREALYRLGAAIVTLWHEHGASDRLMRGDGWIDHPAAIYRAITRDCAEQLPGAKRIPYDKTVFARLAAMAEADFRSGHRARPTKLRDVDLAELPPEPPMDPPPAWAKPAAAREADNARETRGHESVDFSQLRGVLQDEEERSERRAEAWQKRTRQGIPWALGLFIASIILAIVRAL